VICGALVTVPFVHRTRYWTADSLWIPFLLGAVAVGLATTPFWWGMLSAVLGALAGACLLIRGQVLYEAIRQRWTGAVQDRTQASPGERDLLGTGIALSVAASALMLAIAVSIGSSSQVDVARGVLILVLVCLLVAIRANWQASPMR
jgi:hypothetical protein